MHFKRICRGNSVFILICVTGWIYTTPLKINKETQKKLTNKINILLNLKSADSNLGVEEDQDKSHDDRMYMNADSMQSNMDYTNQENTAIMNNDHKDKIYTKPNYLESKYWEACLVQEKDNQPVQKTSEDIVSDGVFGGESMATEKHTHSTRTEHVVTPSKGNIFGDININPTVQSAKNAMANPPHNKFLSAVSPEEFLKRLKKHLEISKSNLIILKKNFYEFVREKEKLFNLNQKVSQEHPHAKSLKHSAIMPGHDALIQESSFAQDPSLLSSQPVTKSCPKDCPINLVDIEHHHHGSSPVPCICENGNLGETVRGDFFLSENIGLHNSGIDFNEKFSSDSGETNPEKERNSIPSSQMNLNDENIVNPNGNAIRNKVEDSQRKSGVINNIPKYYSGCDKPTTHIPAACDIACVPCKTPSPECTPCVICPNQCPSKCLPPGSIITRPTASNICPPTCPPTCPPKCPPTCPPKCPPTCPPTCPPKCPPTCPPKCPPICPPKCPPTCPPTCPPKCTRKCPQKCTPKCPPRCPCVNIVLDANNNMKEGIGSNTALKKEIGNVIPNSVSKLGFKTEQKLELHGENLEKLTMEDVQCTTSCPPTCCPSTCPSTCPTTCCTQPPDCDRKCGSCFSSDINLQKDGNVETDD